MLKPHVWLWIVDKERMVAITDLYDTQIKYLDNILHNTYLFEVQKIIHGCIDDIVPY